MVDRTYSRRSFMKVAGIAAAVPVAALAVTAKPEAAASLGARTARRLMGTLDGLILESADGGKTWRRAANFGKHCAILSIDEQADQFQALVGVDEHSFTLKSIDGKKWFARKA